MLGDVLVVQSGDAVCRHSSCWVLPVRPLKVGFDEVSQGIEPSRVAASAALGSPLEVTVPRVSWSEPLVGGNHSCAFSTTGDLYCWGANESGQSGIDADAEIIAQPSLVPAPSAGTWQDVGLDNERGAVGVPGQDRYTELVELELDDAWNSIAPAIGSHTCGLDSANALYCWGTNDDGVLGLPGGARPSPTPVSLGPVL